MFLSARVYGARYFFGLPLRTLILGSVLLLPLAAMQNVMAAPNEVKPKSILSPVGHWKTIDDETHRPKSLVSLWADGNGILYGKVDSIFPEKGKDTDPLCDKCPGDLKNKKVKQINFLWGLREAEGEWAGGQVLDPAKGTVYRCKIKVKEDGKSLVIRGFIGISLLGRSQTWWRAD